MEWFYEFYIFPKKENDEKVVLLFYKSKNSETVFMYFHFYRMKLEGMPKIFTNIPETKNLNSKKLRHRLRAFSMLICLFLIISTKRT